MNVLRAHVYRNTKNGHLYVVDGFLFHTESQEKLVQYVRLDESFDPVPSVEDPDIDGFARPIESFVGDRIADDGVRVPRFVHVGSWVELTKGIK